MKKRLTIAVVGAALAATLTTAGAQDTAQTTAQTTAYVPNYQRGPRIIHVPQAGERTSVNDRDEPAVSNDNDDEVVPPAPRRRIAPQRQNNTPPQPRTPRWQPRSDAPPPDARRAVLSAPPPPAEGPTPIRPTPRFNSKADPADKFSQPRDARSSAPQPPAGYRPPTALPQEDESINATDK